MTPTHAEEERQRLAELYAAMSEAELQRLADDAGSLTDAAREALKAEILRRGLEMSLRSAVSLRAAAPAPTLIILRQFMSVPEAMLAKSILDSADIECFLADENLVRMDWLVSNAIQGIKLWVRAEDANTAEEMLTSRPPERP